MTPTTRDDALILAWLAEGPAGLTAPERSAIADAAELVTQRRSILPRWRPDTRRLLVFTTAIVALVVATSVLLIGLVGQESPTPSPSPTLTAAPTQAPAARAPACVRSANPEWMGRVRTDLAEMADCGAASFGDSRDAGMVGIDIIAVEGDRGTLPQWRIQLDGFPQAAATLDPDETVIEYGFVFETSGDDIADYLVAINNDAPERGDFRVWVTDLAAETTEEQVGPPYGLPVDFSHPDEHPRQLPTMDFYFIGSPPWGRDPQTARYYAWASVTSGPDVTAWDYAPDFGWLGKTGVGADEDPFTLPYLAPVRVEPAGDPIIRSPTRIDAPTGETNTRWSLVDDVGEADVAGEGIIDLVEMELSRGCLLPNTLCVDFTTETPLGQSPPNPYAEWLAYALDADTDNDGDVDLRLGMDNLRSGHRGWVQDLGIGQIYQAWAPGSNVNVNFSQTEFPWKSEQSGSSGGRLWLGGYRAQWEGEGARFYLWSALVRDGALIGWDFAPNEGWIELPFGE